MGRRIYELSLLKARSTTAKWVTPIRRLCSGCVDYGVQVPVVHVAVELPPDPVSQLEFSVTGAPPVQVIVVALVVVSVVPVAMV